MIPTSWIFLLVLFFGWCQNAYCTADGANDNNPNYHSRADDAVIDKILSQIQEAKVSSSSLLTERPFVTLSFAQSLDGKIAALVVNTTDTTTTTTTTSSNLPISGKESLLLTHALRSCHDAILIGGTTALMDNPRLNNRLWPQQQQQQQQQHQPRPIILDTNLESLLKLGNRRRVQNPIFCCSMEAKARYDEASLNNHDNVHDVTICACKLDKAGRLLDLRDVLNRLRRNYGIKSVMVEGGATVLSTFYSLQLLDYLCITIAPKVIGIHGVPWIVSSANHDDDNIEAAPAFCFSNSDSGAFFPLGNDCIFASVCGKQK